MKLPKIDVPIFTIELPLSKQKLRYRPFLVKEEKILLMAMESQDEKSIMDSIKQVVNNCCLDEIVVDDLPVLDIEYFFLNLRARSINEIVDLQYKCNNVINSGANEEKCNNLVKIQVNLLDIKPEINPNHKNKIEITDKLGMVMRYPNMKMMENIEGSSEVEKIIKVISNCIDYIYDEENVYYRKDIEEKDLLEFIENMTKEKFEKVQEFFETIPKIKKEVNFKCNKCGYQEKIDVEGIQSFFV
jgi:rubrerythrin